MMCTPLPTRARALRFVTLAIAAVPFALSTLLVTATAARGAGLTASWNAPTTNVDGTPLTDLASYRLYYGTSSTPCPGPTFVSAGASSSTPTGEQEMLRLTGLTAGSRYFAALTAVNLGGTEGPCSTVANAVAQVVITVAPAGTTDFGSVGVGATADRTFTVQNAGSGTITGTITTQAPFGVVGSPSFTLSGGATQTVTIRFTPTTAATATTSVTFSADGDSIVRGVTGTGTSAADTTPPTAPGGLTAAAQSPSAIALGWTGSTDNVGVTGYLVERCQASACATFTQVANVTTTGFDDTGLAPSTSYSYRVRATDAAGNLGGYSSTATATTPATPDTTPPTVSLTAPAAGGTVSGMVALQASAADNVGVAGVQFFVDGAAIGAETTTAPYTASWNSAGATNGPHTLTARARDAAGNAATSAAVTVTVDNPAGPPPAAPTLVQRVALGALAPSRGLSSSRFTVHLPNPSLAGNALVLIMDYASGLRVTSITDDAGSAWASTPAASADAGGTLKTEAYVLSNATAGIRAITVTYSAATGSAHFVVLEYANVAPSAAVGATASTALAAAPTISAGPLSPAPAAGNLVLQYAMNNEGEIGNSNDVHQVTAWSAGAGFTLEAADYASGNTTEIGAMNPFALQTGIADGTAVTPRLTTTGAESYNVIALELRAAAAGTPAPPGLRVRRMQFFTNTNIDMGTWSEPFPCSGDLLVFTEIQGNIQSPMTDSQGNAWVVDTRGSMNSAVALQHAPSPTCAPTYVWHAPIAAPGTGNNTTLVMYDIAGADTSAPLVQAVTTAGDASNKSSVLNAPSITPRNPNGLLIVATAIGQGPLTGFAAGAPPTALFESILYPGETDFDSFNNADGYALNAYGASLQQQNYNWTMAPTPNTGFYAVAAEIKAAGSGSPGDTTPPTVPAGLTASATSASQINLAWTASTDNVGVTSYLVERCQGSGCTTFAQVASVTSTSFSNTGLAASTSYSYRVRATDAAGNLSGYSSTATAITPATADTTPPTAPTGLTASATSASQINLAWTASTDNVGVTGYLVERCQGAGCTTFARVASVTSTSFSNTGLAPGTSYSYRVRATDAAGNLSGYSATATAVTSASTAAIAFVQGNYATPQSARSTVTVNYKATQSAGNLNVVIVGWNDATSSVTSVTDTMGNAYTLAVGPTVRPGPAGGGGLSQATYYARDIAGAAAAANTVTVRFNTAATFVDVRILEYRGLDPVSPFEAGVGAAGSSNAPDSGPVTTTSPNVVLVGANMVWTVTYRPGPGFTTRMITSPDGDIAEDRVVSSAGTYNATASLSGAGPWVMQVAAFRAQSSAAAVSPSYGTVYGIAALQGPLPEALEVTIHHWPAPEFSVTPGAMEQMPVPPAQPACAAVYQARMRPPAPSFTQSRYWVADATAAHENVAVALTPPPAGASSVAAGGGGGPGTVNGIAALHGPLPDAFAVTTQN